MAENSAAKAIPDASTAWLTKDHFLKIRDGKLFLWDYRNHAQFEVTLEQLERLIQFSTGDSLTGSTVDTEIAAANILSSSPPPAGWGWDWLAEMFHIGTSSSAPPPSKDEAQMTTLELAKSYLDYCQTLAGTEPEFEMLKGGKIMSLPKPDLRELVDASLWNTLYSRQTCRDFDRTAIPLKKVSAVLYAAFGKMDREDVLEPIGAQRFGFRRTSPSPGGLQSVEAYLWASNVQGLKPGIYHYLPTRHALETVHANLPAAPLSSYVCNQHWADDMAFSVLMTSQFDQMWWKYPHSRAYRPTLMEIGHFAQTLLLCMTASGFHTWMTGYFHDYDLNEILKVNPGKEHALFLVGGGYGSGSGYTREDRILMSEWGTTPPADQPRPAS